MGRAAAFLDRDGTINREVGYLHRPEDVRVLPGVAVAIARLNRAGILVVVVTNQAGIARGYYGAEDVYAVHDRINEVLAAHDARVDALYFCPHHPDFTGPCECRKPEAGMLRQAAAEHAIDLCASWLVGDTLGDVGAGQAAGCRTVLVRTGYGVAAAADLEPGQSDPVVVDDLAAAVDLILGTYV